MTSDRHQDLLNYLQSNLVNVIALYCFIRLIFLIHVVSFLKKS